MKLLPILFACAACLIGSAAEAPNDATFADLGIVERETNAGKRVRGGEKSSELHGDSQHGF